jgi:dynein heavy chain
VLADNSENGACVEDSETYPRMIELWFLFSVIWAFGGSLSDESRKSFDSFLRGIEGQFPSKDTVFEYYVDKTSKSWASWEDKIAGAWRYPNSTPYYKVLVPTVETARNEFIIKSLIAQDRPVLIAGGNGCGKSLLITNILTSLNEKCSNLTINMTRQTSTTMLRNILRNNIEKRSKTGYCPKNGKPLYVFIDDLNLCGSDKLGSYPNHELIRHIMDYSYIYDYENQLQKYVNDVFFIGAIGTENAETSMLSHRFKSRFNIVHMKTPDENCLAKIYGSICSQKLQDFEEDVKSIVGALTSASIDTYMAITTNLLPVPSKLHYLFTLKDLSKLFQGLLRANREYYDSKSSIIKLWIHETHRVFGDRIVDIADASYFQTLIASKAAAHFTTDIDANMGEGAELLYGDLLNENKLYEEILEYDQLKCFLNKKCLEYSKVEPSFSLVISKNATSHILKIIRAYRDTNGHLLFIGEPELGKKSLLKIACFVAELEYIETESYLNHKKFRDDLKIAILSSGLENKQICFVIFENHIDHGVLDDIHSLAKCGEIPDLFSNDEKNQIINEISANSTSGREIMVWSNFIETVRKNLHLTLCLNPKGTKFAQYLSQYPSLVKNMTINWFSDLTAESLYELAINQLSDTLIENPQKMKNIVEGFVAVHNSVKQVFAKIVTSPIFYHSVTVSDFLDMIKNFKAIGETKKMEVQSNMRKLKLGLTRLEKTKQSVEKISKELEINKKQLAVFQKQCEDYLVSIVQQKRETDEISKSVQLKADKLSIEEAEVRQIAESIQEELDHAIPGVIMANKALEGINKKDLNEIKVFGKPPPLVEKVMEGVLILRKNEPTWEEAKRQLGNSFFIKQLINFDKDAISEKILKRISQICADENFDPDIVGRVSSASKALCMWVKAIEVYGNIFKQISPQKEKLRLAKETLEKKQKSMKEAKQKLFETQEKLNELKIQYEERVSAKERLSKEAETTEVKLLRAERLVNSLSGEKDSWEKTIAYLEKVEEFLFGDCLISSAFFSYCGSVNEATRESLLNNHWASILRSLEIGFSPNYTFINFTANRTNIAHWHSKGLHVDRFAVENAIIITQSRRWPLIFDPQNLARNWILNTESSNGLKIVNMFQADRDNIISQSISNGIPLLIEGITEFDPKISTLLTKNLLKTSVGLSIDFDGNLIKCHQNFRLYITTRSFSSNSFSHEVMRKFSLVYFIPTFQGIENLLLCQAIIKEKPELQEQKTALTGEIQSTQSTMRSLEAEILDLLSNSEGSLLENEALINGLQTAKNAAQEIGQKIASMDDLDKKVDISREVYRPIGQRAALVFFAISNLHLVHESYFFSLESYVNLFKSSLYSSRQFEEVGERIASINDYHTYAAYLYIAPSLFERDKIIFALHLALKILEGQGKLSVTEQDFFLNGKGPSSDVGNNVVNSSIEW